MNLNSLTGVWRIAQPLYESVDALGAGATGAVEAPLVSDDNGSLSEHEAAFAPGAQAEPADDAAPAAERDETGKFKPRHRAASQRAGSQDVPRIADLTKKWRTTEAERDAIRAEAATAKAEREAFAKENAELKARLERPAPAAETSKPEAAKTGKTGATGDKFSFPKWDAYLETHPGADYDEWEMERLQAFSDWKDARTNINGIVEKTLHEREAAREVNAAVERSRAKGREVYPDFDAVLKSGPGASVNLHATDENKASERCTAIFAHPQSEHIQYAIMKDADLAKRLASMDDISFGIELAALVASAQRSPSTRSAAASTGSAPATSRPTAPRPPNPVRTGSIAEPDTPPDPDDQSLSSHEKFYGRTRR